MIDTKHIWSPNVVHQIMREEHHVNAPAGHTVKNLSLMFEEFREYIRTEYPGCEISIEHCHVRSERAPKAQYDTFIMTWAPETKQVILMGGSVDRFTTVLDHIGDVYHVYIFTGSRTTSRAYYYIGWDPQTSCWAYKLKGA